MGNLGAFALYRHIQPYSNLKNMFYQNFPVASVQYHPIGFVVI